MSLHPAAPRSTSTLHPHATPLRLAALLLCTASIATASVQYIWGPPGGHSGAPAIGGKPAEENCTDCHTRVDENYNPLPNLNVPGGRIELLDIPASYVAGQSYTIRVRLSCDSTATFPNRTWGFQLVALRASDGENAGLFDVAGRTDVQLVSGAEPGTESRSYVEHREAGVFMGAASPVEWAVNWQAPAASEGMVYFCAAGNAGNGFDDTFGDYIFTTTDSTYDRAVATRRDSWTALKLRFR